MRKKNFTTREVFGCSETISDNCPTFLERKVHNDFKNAILTRNIIVVYGESKQGKTWTVEKYCKSQCRIGCTNDMDLRKIKEIILAELGFKLQEIKYEQEVENSKNGQIAMDLSMIPLNASSKVGTQNKRSEKFIMEYKNLDENNLGLFTKEVKKRLKNGYLVFDNFHYLNPEIQKQFCSMLKEFNYQDIKVIIVGVWKEAAKITALAPDLNGRCRHIDIGMWNTDELLEIIKRGEAALNVQFADEEKALFCSSCANNIGIFKLFLEQYCLKNDITETQKNRKTVNDIKQARDVINEFIEEEAFSPIRDRLKNLSMPRKKKTESKFMRKKIVLAILKAIIEKDVDGIRKGIDISTILSNIEKNADDKKLQQSNIIQELGLLHNREENKEAGENFIPLFYYDKTNQKLLVLEPLLYVIKNYNPSLLERIISEINS